MANPAHWMKLKIMRHVKSLPADFIIIDLGAGVHFNTLDFFSMSDRGIVITAPEPGAVMNAYSFIKGALFRRLQGVFKKDPRISPIIEAETKKTAEESSFTLEWLTAQVTRVAPDMLPLIKEIEVDFQPALVVNQMDEGEKHILVENLLSLCTKRLGISIEHTGNLPRIPEITHYLLNIPGFLDTLRGKPYLDALQDIADKLVSLAKIMDRESVTKTDFSDEEVEEITSLIDSLDDSVFSGTDRNRWKLRMYFKPSDVIDFLVSRGISHKTFYQ
jgi:flagellar biosynthesis protein FlhG